MLTSIRIFQRGLSLFFLLSSFSVFGTDIVYADANGTGSGDGSTWGNAHLTLVNALELVQKGQDIWITNGTYYPSLNGDIQEPIFFDGTTLIIRGGFAGTEEFIEERDLENNQTILSGNLNDSQEVSDNSRVLLYLVDASSVLRHAISFRDAFLGEGEAPDCAGDLNGDLIVCGGDLLESLAQFESFGTLTADFDNHNAAGANDLLVFLSVFRTNCL